MVTNPKDFGAVGDGVHDDTAAIQAALDVAHVDGYDIIYVSKGTYRLTKQIRTGSTSTKDLEED